MSQLVHFVLNAKLVTSSIPAMLTQVIAKLTSLKLNTIDFKVKHFLTENDSRVLLFSQNVFGLSVTSLTLVNSTNSEFSEADSTAFCLFLLRYFTALNSR
ncbi:hypothetical protein TYRP_020816 [Tyrophagus putrescentiae]|nr:hypothetical protein TYRP_020816 [Tyrophagus putrescentiae]